MKAHCARMSFVLSVHGETCLRISDRSTRYAVGDGSTYERSLCGAASNQRGGAVGHEYGGVITHPDVFCWLPKRAQCGRCHVLYDPFQSHSIFTRTPHGQRFAPPGHAIDIEVMLLGLCNLYRPDVPRALATGEQSVNNSPTCR